MSKSLAPAELPDMIVRLSSATVIVYADFCWLTSFLVGRQLFLRSCSLEGPIAPVAFFGPFFFAPTSVSPNVHRVGLGVLAEARQNVIRPDRQRKEKSGEWDVTFT